MTTNHRHQVRSRTARSSRDTLFGLALAATVVGCGGGSSVAPPTRPDPIAIEIAVATTQEIPEYLDFTGSLLADRTARIPSLTTARVLAVDVEVGQTVAKGDLLVTLDDEEAQWGLEQAQAGATQAESNLVAATASAEAARHQAQIARDNTDRMAALAKSGDVAKAAADQAEQEAAIADDTSRAAQERVAQARTAIVAAKVQLKEAQHAVDSCRVTAPFGGVVIARTVEVGELAAAGSEVVALAKLDPIEVEISVPEARAGRLREGLAARIGVAAFPDRWFEGTVHIVSPVVDASTRTLQVSIRVPNGDRSLRPGMFARGRVTLPTTRSAVTVPPAAVRTTAGDGSTSGSATVFLVVTDTVRSRIIATSEGPEDVVVVSSGLAAGERVATSGIDQLADGALVTYNE